MENFPDITIKTRFLVLFLDAKFTSNRISTLLKIPLRTVQDWEKKTKDGKDIRQIKVGRGSKQVVSPGIQGKVARNVREKPFKASTRKLASKYEIGKSTVDSILGKRGFQYKKVTETMVLTDEEKLARMEYCQGMLKWSGRKINQAFFIDETCVWLSDAYKKQAWSKPTKKLKVEKPRVNIKLNVWGAISVRGATSLEIYEGNLDSRRYKEILETHSEEMSKLYRTRHFVIHDNHRAHKASEPWMDSLGFNRVEFPTYSPDLNPIENLWATLKDRVARDHPYTASQLRNCLIKHWNILTTPENLRPYFENLHQKYKTCIDIRGEIVPD